MAPLPLALLMFAGPAPSPLDIPIGTWVKLSPLPGGPTSPRLGYEGACAWDSVRKLFIRYGGHNQGGGGEQNAELWLFDPATAAWTFREPNVSPPGVCCAQQDVFDPTSGLFIRFPSFSLSHGWQWPREIYLNDSSVWVYDVSTNRWRNRNPLPATNPKPLRCASWDTDRQVVVLFGGESSHEGTLVYDPYANAWTRMRPAMEPEFRSGGNMAYDAARKLHILFGSQFSDDRHTWAYDLAKNEWRDMKPPEMPPTDQNDAVLTYDPFRKLIVAIVKITEGKDEDAKHRLETWTYDAVGNRWSKLSPAREPDPTGNRARVLVFAPELNAALLENRTHPPHGPPEQQMWALRLGLRPSATYGTSGILRAWLGPAPADPETAPLSDPRRAKGGRIRAEPRIIEDVVVSVISAREIEVAWKVPPESGVAGYRIERAAAEVLTEDQLTRLKSRTPPLAPPSAGIVKRIGAFVSLTPSPIAATTFVDRAIDLARPAKIEGDPIYEREIHADLFDSSGAPYRFAVYAYRVRAVNAQGVESGPSPAVLTIPSPVQYLFSKEDGRTCLLKWAANPEKGIAGYRVYRMDGRYDNEKISRLTADPVRGLTYADPEAGDRTRRYYVLAVDAIGQEGCPSSPVWYDREWKAYYVPFVGEWHQ